MIVYSGNVPDKAIYDPVSGAIWANNASLAIEGSKQVTVAFRNDPHRLFQGVDEGVWWT